MPLHLLHETFTLYEPTETLGARDLLSIGSARQKRLANPDIVNVQEEGTAALVAAMTAVSHGGMNLFILRDASVPPPSSPGPHESPKIWLQTSGTTGKPKWVAHDVEALTSKIGAGRGDRARWLLSFNPASFAGLQVIFSAMKGGHGLIVPEIGAGIVELANLAIEKSATHISGTPTFWRAFLMVLGDATLDLKAVTIGGEAPDQTILDALRHKFPGALLRHIYASTEVGTLFSVNDGRAGFPRQWLDKGVNGIRLGISAHDTLTVLNPQGSDQASGETWDTKDVVELAEDRVLFRGRLDSMVNIGGTKVYPEEIENFLLQLPFIQEARVVPRANPITGNILTAEIMAGPFMGDLQAALKSHVAALPRAARPASFRIVKQLDIGATGKKRRETAGSEAVLSHAPIDVG